MGIRLWIICTVFLLLTACSPPIAIEDKSIISVVGFDKEEDKIQITALIQNPAVIGKTQTGGAKQDEKPVSILKTEGHTIDFAVHWSSNFVPRHVDWNHLQFVIIGEDMARDNIKPVLDFLQRQPEARTLPYIFIGKEVSARELLEKSTEFTDPPSRIITEIIHPAIEHNNLRATRVYEVLNDFNSPLLDITIPGIFMGNTDNYKTAGGHETFQISNKIGLIRDGKLVGWLDKQVSAGLLWIEGDRWDHAVELWMDKYKVYVNHDITSNNSKKTILFSGNQIKKIQIELNVVSKISEISGDQIKLDNKMLNDIEKEMNRFIQKRVEKAVHNSQKYKVDIFGLGYEVRKSNQSYWEKNRMDWSKKIYPDIPVDVKVKSTIENTGDIVEPLEKEKEKK